MKPASLLTAPLYAVLLAVLVVLAVVAAYVAVLHHVLRRIAHEVKRLLPPPRLRERRLEREAGRAVSGT